MAGLRLPIETHLLQGRGDRAVEALPRHRRGPRARRMSTVSQSDKGELVFGGDLDFYNSYAPAGQFCRRSRTFTTGAQSRSSTRFRRLRLMRSWGGVMDMTMDGSPIIGKTPLRHFYIDGGWCYGGFKATPGSGWVFRPQPSPTTRRTS